MFSQNKTTQIHKEIFTYYTKCNIAGPSNWICRNIFKLCQTESRWWLIFTYKRVKLFTPLGAGTSGSTKHKWIAFYLAPSALKKISAARIRMFTFTLLQERGIYTIIICNRIETAAK